MTSDQSGCGFRNEGHRISVDDGRDLAEGRGGSGHAGSCEMRPPRREGGRGEESREREEPHELGRGGSETQARDRPWSRLPAWLPETAFGVPCRRPAGARFASCVRAPEVSSRRFAVFLPEWVLFSWKPHLSLLEDTAMAAAVERASAWAGGFLEGGREGPARREKGAQEAPRGEPGAVHSRFC